MLTVMIMPNFKGTVKETIQCCLGCLAMDAIYLIPMFF